MTDRHPRSYQRPRAPVWPTVVAYGLAILASIALIFAIWTLGAGPASQVVDEPSTVPKPPAQSAPIIQSDSQDRAGQTAITDRRPNQRVLPSSIGGDHPRGPVDERGSPFRVCIDPGHPSEKNSGDQLVNGLREVDICWKVALLLADKLRAQGIEVAFTKNRVDEFVTNRDRALIANQSRCDLMVRIHADSGGGRGFTVYYPRLQGTAQGTTGPSKAVLAASAQSAREFDGAFASTLANQLNDNGLRGDEKTKIGSDQGALTGSIFSKVPTLLVEMAFLDNKSDAAWLSDATNQDLMAEAFLRGILAARANDHRGGHR